MREKKENLPKYCTMSLIPDFIVIPFSNFLWVADFITFRVSVLTRWHTRTSWLEARTSRYTGSLRVWIWISPDLLRSFLGASFPNVFPSIFDSDCTRLRFNHPTMATGCAIKSWANMATVNTSKWPDDQPPQNRNKNRIKTGLKIKKWIKNQIKIIF